MKTIFTLDSRINNEILENLKNINNNIVLIQKNPSFDDAVSAHPDMNILQVKDRIFTCTSTNVRLRNATKIKYTKRGKLQYPDDVQLNAVCIGNDFICRKKSVNENALEYAQKLGMNIIDVNQGYVKCNIAIVDEENKAVITEDEGICKTLTENGYAVLLLKTHDVGLEPYKFGFIGGATGLFEKTLLFTGNIKKHSEYKRIKEFCDGYGVKIQSLSNDYLYDYGSILTIVTE